MVQTRWTYLNRDYSLLTQVETILLDGHFVIEHGARSRRGTFFNFNGTAGVWRRAAIDDAGGWQHDTLTEDTDLSYRAQLNGWKFLLPAANRVPVRAARRHERLQSAAGALGQGPDADRQENPAQSFPRRCSVAREGRSFLPSHRQHQLPADGVALHHAAARHDRALLSGLVPDAGDRSAAFPGLHLLDFQLLSGGAKRAAP